MTTAHPGGTIARLTNAGSEADVNVHPPLRVGDATTNMDPATGELVAVRVDAVENGEATLTVVAPPQVPLSKVREPHPPIALQ